MTTSFVDVDVRPILRAGGEPFELIMSAVNALAPGQGLRLFATFEPTPLFHVLGARGFSHVAKPIDGGDWEVLFQPSGAVRPDGAPARPASGDGAWPAPVRRLDLRDLDPPEPMVRILAALEAMAAGEVLAALLCREPVFLLPELAKRGHAWRGGFEPDRKTYALLVRVGDAREAAA